MEPLPAIAALRDKGISVKKLKADCLASLIRYHHDNPKEKDAKKWFNKLKKEKKLSFELLINQ